MTFVQSLLLAWSVFGVLMFPVEGSVPLASRRAMEANVEEFGFSHVLQRFSPWHVRLDAFSSSETRPLMSAQERKRVSSKAGTISITTTPTVLEKSGDFVTISVVDDEASRDRTGDVLAAYAPADADMTEKSPARVVQMYQFPEYVSTGVINVTMALTNMRSDYGFALFSYEWWCDPSSSYGCSNWAYFGGDDAPGYLLATSATPVTFMKGPTEPRAARVLPGRDDDENWEIVWTSGGYDVDPTRYDDFGCVTQQLDADDIEIIRGPAVTSTAYTIDELCGSPANDVGFRDPGLIHRVQISCDDAPGTAQAFSYRCGNVTAHLLSEDDEDSVLFAPKTFRCPPYDDITVTKIAIFGDLGRGESPDDASQTWKEYGGDAAAATAALLAESVDDLDFVYHVGDLSYAVGYGSVWDDYLDMMEPVISAVGYGVNLGNHESDMPSDTFPSDRTPTTYTGSDSYGECGVPASRLLPMPTADYLVSKPEDAPWWSKDIGLVHVMAMASERDFTTDSPQLKWIEEDLKAVDRSKTPWVVFGAHRPIYIDSNYRNSGHGGAGDIDVMDAMIKYVEPLLLRYSVDLVVTGHNHAVQRTCAVANRTCLSYSDSDGVYHDPSAPVYLVVGTGGASFTKNAVGADFIEKVFYSWGFGRVDATVDRLDYTFFDNGANLADDPDSLPGRVLDHASIVRGGATPAPVAAPTAATNAASKKKSSNDDDSPAMAAAIAAAVLAVALAMVLAGVVLKLRHNRNRGPARQFHLDDLTPDDIDDDDDTKYTAAQHDKDAAPGAVSLASMGGVPNKSEMTTLV